MSKPITVRYRSDSESAFEKTLRSRVQVYLRRNGRTANFEMWARIAVYFALYFGCWSALAFAPHSFPVTLTLVAGLVLAYKCIAYNVVHDGVHVAITGNSRIDQAIYAFSLSILGPDPHLWRTRHTVDHHHYVNVPGLDSQIESAAFLRLSPHQKWRSFHRWQHVYAPFLYGLVTLHWIFVRDVVDLRRENPSFGRWAIFLARKAAYVFGMIVVPAIFLPYSFGTVLLGFVGFHFLLSILVTLTFAISHVNDDLHFVGRDASGNIGHSYLEHQLITSMDYHPANVSSNWIFGGMSAHVAHHMFPSVSSARLRALTRVVEGTAREFGMTYHRGSIPELVAGHFRLLQDMGKSPRHGHRRMWKSRDAKRAG